MSIDTVFMTAVVVSSSDSAPLSSVMMYAEISLRLILTRRSETKSLHLVPEWTDFVLVGCPLRERDTHFSHCDGAVLYN
jgi:hypothetical protein